MFSIRSTERREATCREVECNWYLHGWHTIVPIAGPQAEYIRHRSGRRFRETCESPGLATFVFEPGQKCFQTHKVKMEGYDVLLKDGQEQQSDRWLDGLHNLTDEIVKKVKEGSYG